VLIPAGVAVYAGLLWALRLEGREELLALLLRRRGSAAGTKDAQA
jgi:hypothetical protein